MKQISPSRKTAFVAECSALLIASLALSYLEAVLPVSAVIPFPGFKPGLANVAVIIAFFRISPYAAAVISAARCFISSILFSGVTTLMFSLSGAALSFTVLLVLSLIFKDKISFIGLSVTMAFFHNVGQLICAGLVMHTASVFYYFPVLTAAALIFGVLTGVILSALPNKIYSSKDAVK